MALGNYSDLKAAIADYLDRDDLTAQIDDFLLLAQKQIGREVRVRQLKHRAQTSVSDRYVPLPERFTKMVSFILLTDPVTRLTELSQEELNRRRIEEASATRLPCYYTIHEEIEFDVVPDQAYTAEMIYYAAPPLLSAANSTTELLTSAPDLYLYGALVAASPFLIDDERIPIWQSLYANARDTANHSDRLSRHGGSLVSRVSGATP